MIAILHNIRSLFNVGSIFRTADAAGIEKIFLCGITPAPLDDFGDYRPQLSKVALGAEKTVAWEKCATTPLAIKKLKSDGYTIVALEQAPDAEPYYNLRGAQKIALIVGHEVKGVPKNILNLADKLIYIPMYGKKESLNVAVAFGIAVFGIIEPVK